MATKTLKKQKNGYSFRIRVYDYVKGRNVQVFRSGFKTRKEAEEAEYRLRQEYVPKEIKKLEKSSFESVYDEYLSKRKKEKKLTSFYNIIPSLNKNILEPFKDMKISDITKQHFNRWYKELDERNLTIHYKNFILREMKGLAIFIRKNYRIDLTFIEDEPSFRDDEFKSDDKKYYTIDQFNTFIQAVDDVLYKAMFNTLFYTGLRLGELRALTWNDYKDTFINVEKTMNTRIIKHTGKPIVTVPKTRKSVRTVTIPRQASSSLIEHYNQCKLKSGFKSSWYIFGDSYPIAENTIRNRLRYYAKKSNLEYLHPHGFRHSFITALYQLGVDEMITSKAVGHESIATTRNIYTHISNKQKDDVIYSAFDSVKKED